MWEKLKDLKGRLIIHLSILFLASILIYTSVFFISKILVFFVVSGIIFLANLEFQHLAKAKGIAYSIFPSIPIIFIWPALVSFSVNGSQLSHLYVALVFLTLLAFVIMNFKKIDQSIASVSIQTFSHIYITIPLSLIIAILHIDGIGLLNDGRIWLAYLICVAKGSDVGGYFIGSLYGKRPLAPQVSPKKTIEGCYGAFALSIVVSLSFWVISRYCPPGLFSISFIESVLLGFFISLIAQIGDLSESLFKRDAKIKDSSSIPAVGGILDIVDSLIFTTPLLYCYLALFR